MGLDFTATHWGPLINVVFIANACTAYMEDFSLRPVAGETRSPLRGQ